MEDTRLLEESSERLKAILDGIGEGISIIDEDLKIIWVNSIIEKWAGSLDDLKGKYCYKAYQKRDEPCENCPTLKAFKTKKIQKARQFAIDNKGNIKYFEFTSSPMLDEDGRIQAVIELAVDLTEKIQLEHKLKETKDRLQAIFDGIGDGVSVVDRNYQILRVNRAILKMFNKRDYLDLIGKKCFMEYHKEEVVCESCPVEKTFSSGEPSHITKAYQEHDKGKIVLDIYSFPIKDDEGEVMQVIEYIKDVTNSVKLEDQLLYQERLAATGELAAGIAHEIRNPLGNISASTQFVLSKYKLNEVLRKHLKIVLKNAQNANRIIKDLLDFAKPNEVSFKMSSVSSVVESVCNLVKVRCIKQRVRLAKRISRRLPSLLLDKKQLEEAFLNFMLNSIDAMPEGGRLTITVYPDSENNEIVVNFSDTGCGISPENLNKLFQPFFTTKADGVGLGLYLARQVIGYHKGKVNIESKIGEGTKVIVRLAIQRERGGGGGENK
ncbi:MAG: PAS domain-containing protein [Candidatus Omnitrophota bacterium]|nr:PAS domain-containing protein [Candidatus Omnitrophota bacterium]